MKATEHQSIAESVPDAADFVEEDLIEERDEEPIGN